MLSRHDVDLEHPDTGPFWAFFPLVMCSTDNVTDNEANRGHFWAFFAHVVCLNDDPAHNEAVIRAFRACITNGAEYST